MSRRSKHPRLNSFSNTRFLKPQIESLEERMAPGFLLDMFGMAALVQIGGKSDLLDGNRRTATPSPLEHRPAELRSYAKELLASNPRTEDHLLNALVNLSHRSEDESIEWFSDLMDSVGIENLASPLEHDPQWLQVDWQLLGKDASSLTMNTLFVQRTELTQPIRGADSFVLGGGNVGISTSAYSTGHARMALSEPSPESPAVETNGIRSADFASMAAPNAPIGGQPELGGLDMENLDFANLDLGGAIEDLSGDAVEESKVDNVHRLPPELQNRDDSLLEGQSLEGYSISHRGMSNEPTTGVVKSPTEYDPMRGVLFSYISGQYNSVVVDMVKELTEDPNTDDIAYVVVPSASVQASATTAFTNAGANMSKVQFMIQPMNALWIRDYGPHFVTVDGSLEIVDSHYYPGRPLDNFIPTLVGDSNFNMPTYDMGLYYSGGNFQPGPNGSGFVTALVNGDNPAGDGFDASLIAELYHRYQGIETLHVLPQLPFSVDGTGHIDMWLYLVDSKTVVISEFIAGSNSTAITITNNAVGYMENLGFTVYRTPAWNSGGTHYTYTNAFRVNNRILVPVYGTAIKPGGSASYNTRDAQAMATWQAAAGPNVEIIPIQCYSIIPAAGAIHCIVKQVPRYLGEAPAVNIVSPAGGETLTPGSQYKIEWSAIDTNNVDPAQIDIYVDYGNGIDRLIATTSDTGSYVWTVSNRVPNTTSATISIVARSVDGDSTLVTSQPFSISEGRVTTYDFARGAGVDLFAYGSQTTAWSNVDGNPMPVSTQLTPTNYARLSTSNATGQDTDTNRYIAPVPSPASAESTHVFTFQLAPAFGRFAQIDVLWEGYGDFCTQVELYVWDRVAQNWGDGTGLTGVNRYMDSWAGNSDGELTGSIRSDFSRYVDETGLIRFLVYTDRPGAVGSAGSGIETFHDYMSVTVTQTGPRLSGNRPI